MWQLEPSLSDPDTIYASVEDAARFRSTDGGHSWTKLAGLREHRTSSSWEPGAGGMCLHTIVLDPSNHDRMYVAISAAGAFRSDDAGVSWEAINRGLHAKRPEVLFMQKHWDVMRSERRRFVDGSKR